MTVWIRAAELTDIDALVDLLEELFTQEADFEPDRQRQRRGLEAILANPAVGQVFVAEYHSIVIGMVSLLHTVSTALGGPVCWLEDMVVVPEARGQQVGSLLLEHALDWARERGVLRVTLLTDHDTLAAVRFYERAGFQRSQMQVLRQLLKND